MNLLEVPVPIIVFPSIWPSRRSGAFRFPYARSTLQALLVKRISFRLDDSQENPGSDSYTSPRCSRSFRARLPPPFCQPATHSTE
jgi:hypothetical protein